MMYIFLEILQYTLFTFFALSTFHVVVLSVAARFFPRLPAQGLNFPLQKIAILIPCYKEDSIIISSINSYTLLEYPADYFTIFLIADSLLPETLIKLKKLPVRVIEAFFSESTVTRSIQMGIEIIKAEAYAITLICDADNILKPDFLQLMNGAFNAGNLAVQGCRFTKNMNTGLAVLDSMSEIINNHLYRKGSYALGLSSALIGSGMAFNTNLLYECMAENHSLNGYDRELQLLLSERGISIAYLETAICYDEKVSNSPAFENQRKRWIASQFTNLNEHFLKALRMLGKRGGLNYFHFAIVLNIFLNRILNLGLLFIFSAASLLGWLLLKHAPLMNPVCWVVLFLLYAGSLILAIPSKFFNQELLHAVLNLPRTFLSMAGLLFKTGEARKKFIHTKHMVHEIDLDVETGIPKNLEK